MISSLARWRAIWLSVPSLGPKTLLQIATVSQKHTGQTEAQALATAWRMASRPQPAQWLQRTIPPDLWSKLRTFQNQTDPDALMEHWITRDLQILTDQDPGYPQALRPLIDRPPVLFCKGVWPKSAVSIGMVGTRRPTWYGEVMTDRLIKSLIGQDVCLISGVMVGIDSLVHRAALDSNLSTIGVLGYGFDYCYPRSQARLLAEIVDQGGLLVSEVPPHQAPRKHQFILRNRIIAGLSQAVVVIEAAERSGTMITVEYALEYGRAVGAVPGPLTSQVSQGTAQLIRQGAACITSGEDIGFELGHEWRSGQQSPVMSTPRLDTPAKLNVWQSLQSSGQQLDDLLKISAVSLEELLDVLGEWEEEGWIKNQVGMYTLAR